MVGFSFVFHSRGGSLETLESLHSLESLENGLFWRDPFSRRPPFRTVGSSLLPVELFYLQLCLGAFWLTLGAFLLTVGAFFAYNWSLFLLQWERWETDFYTPPVLGGAALLPFSAPAVYKNQGSLGRRIFIHRWRWKRQKGSTSQHWWCIKISLPKERLTSTLTDCKPRSSAVSKKAPTVSK